MSNTQKNRVYYADVLRLIAIIAVIAVHILGGWYMQYFDSSKLLFGVLHFCGALCSIAVPTFLMLTGAFMLSKTYIGSYWNFFKKRVLGLLIPFLIFSLIYYTNTRVSLGEPLSALGFLVSFTTGDIMYHFWFMYTIILFYMLIPFLSRMVQSLERKELQNLILVLAGASLLSSVSAAFSIFGKNFLSSFVLPEFVLLMNYLFIGYYLYRYPVLQRTRKWIYVVAVTLLVATTIFDVAFADMWMKDILLYSSRVTAMMISVAFFLRCQHNARAQQPNAVLRRILNFIIPLVFYIYMAHVLVLDYVRPHLLALLHPEKFVSVCAFMLVELVVVLALSIVVAFVFDKLYGWGRMACRKIAGKIKARIGQK